MISLRNRWRRSWLHQYFAAMTPTDRAVALIAIALALAIGLSFNAIARRQASGAPQQRLTTPPFTMDFAAVRP